MRSIIQFAVRCAGPSGGALKVRHYFEHALDFEHVLASEFGARTALFMPADTPWTAGNPWTPHRSRARSAIDWSAVAVAVISGWGWDRFIPARFHAAPPFRIIYLVQSFGRIDPRDSQFRHLANPATRICVSRPLERALRGQGTANGPIHAIPAGIEPDVLRTPRGSDAEVLIVGFKRPDIARSLASALAGSGIAAEMLMDTCPRREFLRRLAGARVVVCLPAVREGFYLPALESMAVGSLTVCPDVLGNDYCADRINCFKPAYRVEALAQAVAEAAELDASRVEAMRRAAQATAREYSYDAERRRFQAVLRGVLG